MICFHLVLTFLSGSFAESELLYRALICPLHHCRYPGKKTDLQSGYSFLNASQQLCQSLGCSQSLLVNVRCYVSGHGSHRAVQCPRRKIQQGCLPAAKEDGQVTIHCYNSLMLTFKSSGLDCSIYSVSSCFGNSCFCMMSLQIE